MPFQAGDKIKYKEGVGPEQLSNNKYIVLEYFVNAANQKTFRVRNSLTNEETYKDPDLMELIDE